MQRTSLDLLDPLPIAVIVENSKAVAQTLRFRQPTEYAIEVGDDTSTVWSSQPPSPPPGVSYPVHSHEFAPGKTTLVIYDWDGLTRGRWSPLAGKYTIRVRLLSEGTAPETALHVVFAPPVSPSSLLTLRPQQEFTLVGNLGENRDELIDARGGARLERKILSASPGTRLVARGYVVVHPDGSRTFSVERWAPYGAP